MSENIVVNACIKWLFAHGCFVWRNNSGAWTPEGSKRPIRYGKVGSSDIIGVNPHGRLLCIECKWGNNDLSLPQIEFQRRITDKRGLFITVWNNTDILEQRKEEILSPTW